MSSVVTKIVFTALGIVIGGIFAYWTTRPQEESGHQNRQSRRPPPRRRPSEGNKWKDDDDGLDSSGSNTTRRHHSTSEVENSRGDIQCPICLDPYKTLLQKGEILYITTCGHVFCKDCILEYFKGREVYDCPMCRDRIVRRQLKRVFLT